MRKINSTRSTIINRMLDKPSLKKCTKNSTKTRSIPNSISRQGIEKEKHILIKNSQWSEVACKT